MPETSETSETITTGEWLDELQKLTEATDDEGLTVQEIVNSVGHDRQWVALCIKRGLKEGLVRRGHAKRERIDGRFYVATVYRFVKADKKKKDLGRPRGRSSPHGRIRVF